MIVNTMLTLLRLLFFGRGHCPFVGAEALQLSAAVALLFALAVLTLAECYVVVHFESASSLQKMVYSFVNLGILTSFLFALVYQRIGNF